MFPFNHRRLLEVYKLHYRQNFLNFINLTITLSQIESVDTDGRNRHVIMDEDHASIAKPAALAVMDQRLYYMDPKYEQVVKVDLPDGTNEKVGTV